MGKTNKKTVHPLFKYHPVRYALIRGSFLGRAIETLNQDYSNNLSTVFATENQKAYKIVSNGIRSHLETSKSKDLYPSCLQVAYKQLKQYSMLNQNSVPIGAFDLLKTIDDFEFQVFKEYASFINSGSNIFEFPSELLNVFWETDVDDVSLEEIHLPFATVYLHFGKQDGKKLYGTVESMQEESRVREHPLFGQKCVDFFLDGAYVSKCPKSEAIDIVLTGIRNSPNYYGDNYIDNYEEAVNYKLTLFKSEVTVEDALKHKVEELERQIKEIYNQKLTERVEDRQFLESTLKDSETYTNKSINQFTNCLRLVVNCLLYLQSYPDEIEDDYPESAPAYLVAQTKTKNFVTGVAARKLSDMGYRKIKFCGRNSQLFQRLEDESVEEIPNVEDSISSSVSRTMSPHKRRTHRRKQRYGKGLQLWRYVWIKETTIHPQKYQPLQDFYRIYEVVE